MNTKKNIVLVTWIGGGNYGTSLQSFALHRKIEMLGYNVSFLREFPKKFTFKNRIKYCLILLGFDISKIKKIIKPRQTSLKQRKLNDFISENYNFCKPINSNKELDKLVSNTDVFVTGSDQIWNTAYCFNPFCFLDFARDAKRIAYASSIGLTDFPEEHKEKVTQLINKFSHIGLREETAVKAVSKLLKRKNIIQVIDPTFLLDSRDWYSITKEAIIEIDMPKRYILCYLIGSNSWYVEQLKSVISETGISNVVVIPAVENPNFTVDGAIVYESAGPLEFVKLIQNAALVCTDSFHATAISINLNIDFVEFMRFKDTDTISQNSRIYDILIHYQLMNRIYSDNNTEWSQKIDYTYANKQLEQDRKVSIDYLVNAIEH